MNPSDPKNTSDLTSPQTPSSQPDLSSALSQTPNPTPATPFDNNLTTTVPSLSDPLTGQLSSATSSGLGQTPASPLTPSTPTGIEDPLNMVGTSNDSASFSSLPPSGSTSATPTMNESSAMPTPGVGWGAPDQNAIPNPMSPSTPFGSTPSTDLGSPNLTANPQPFPSPLSNSSVAGDPLPTTLTPDPSIPISNSMPELQGSYNPLTENQPGAQPSITSTPPVSEQPPIPLTDQAPTDLSHLISPDNNQHNDAPVFSPPMTQPESLVVPPNEGAAVMPNIPTEGGDHKGFPKWVIGVGIGLLLAVSAASAYFILGLGQTEEVTSVPIPPNARQSVVTPVPTSFENSAPTESTGNFGSLEGTSSPSPTQQATSAADLIRQRQGR